MMNSMVLKNDETVVWVSHTSYHTLSQQAEDLVDCPFFYPGSHFSRAEIANFPEGWRVERALDTRGGFKIKDKRGETRRLEAEEVLSLSRFSDWLEYDQHVQRKELERLQQREREMTRIISEADDRISALLRVLAQVDRINSQAGPGSRKAVRELIRNQAL